jgi:uncharacterized protein
MTNSSRVLIERDVLIEMRDGIRLAADVYRPDDAEQHPVLIQRTPYDKNLNALALLQMDTLRAVARGYAVVIQDVRGRYQSEGEFTPFFQETADGYDTVEWCAAQPWSTGRIGMYGASYVGAVQWLAALAAPPHLTCIAPMLTSSDYYEGWTYQGGALQWGFMVSWLLPFWTAEAVFRHRDEIDDFEDVVAELSSLIDQMDQTFQVLPLEDLPVVKDFSPYFREWLAHPTRDDFWRAISIEDRHAALGIPAFNVGGWYDIFLIGTLRNFAGMRASAATPEARHGARLLMGPWAHAVPTANEVGSHDFGIRSAQFISPPLRYDLDEAFLRFFDFWLHGHDNCQDQDPPVRLFVMGENTWRDEHEWPLARTQFTHFFLHSEGKANGSTSDGWLDRQAPAEEPSDVFLYDPRRPVPTRGGGLCCYPTALSPGAHDQRDIEQRDDVLVFCTAPLEQDMEVTGPVTMELWASSSAPDTDFTAKLVDRAPCGYARNLTDGIIRASSRSGSTQDAPLNPGEPYRFRIDLGATSNLFRSGHQIVLEISSSNFPRFNRNSNTGGDLGRETKLRPALQMIFHDPGRASRITLPIIPR